MSQRFVTLADGRTIRLGKYVAAWRQCIALAPATHIGKGVDGWGQTAGEALADLRRGMHDRINRHLAHYGKGRNWSPDAQRVLVQVAHQVNGRRALREVECRWFPRAIRERVAHKISTERDF